LQAAIAALVAKEYGLSGVEFDVIANNDSYVNHLFIRWDYESTHPDTALAEVTSVGVEIYAGLELRFVTNEHINWKEEALEDWHRGVAEFTVRAYLMLG
jgi:sugar phosphate isomerase/epimerase